MTRIGEDPSGFPSSIASAQEAGRALGENLYHMMEKSRLQAEAKNPAENIAIGCISRKHVPEDVSDCGCRSREARA